MRYVATTLCRQRWQLGGHQAFDPSRTSVAVSAVKAGMTIVPATVREAPTTT